MQEAPLACRAPHTAAALVVSESQSWPWEGIAMVENSMNYVILQKCIRGCKKCTWPLLAYTSYCSIPSTILGSKISIITFGAGGAPCVPRIRPPQNHSKRLYRLSRRIVQFYFYHYFELQYDNRLCRLHHLQEARPAAPPNIKYEMHMATAPIASVLEKAGLQRTV